MWQAQPALALGLLSFTLGCSGEPFELEPPPGPPPGEIAAPRGPSLAAAVRGASELVVFDPISGQPSASVELGGPIVDLSWHGPSGRLLVLEATPELDATRARSFVLGRAGLVLVSSSPPFGPDARILGVAAGALLVTNEMGASFTALDPGLSPAGPTKLVAKPESLHSLGDAWDALALARAGSAGADADRFSVASFENGWHVESTEWPAPQRPVSRLAPVSPGRGHLVRKWMDSPRFALANFPGEPVFTFRAAEVLPSAELEEVAWDAEQRALVALLSRPARPAMLVTLGVEAGALSSALELDGAAEVGVWLGKRIARASKRTLLVATSAGLSVLAASGTPEAPAYAPVRVLPDLGPPLVSLAATDTW